MIARRRLRVIVNPSARGGAGRRAVAALARKLPATDAPTEVTWTESRSAAHLQEIVAAWAEDGSEDPIAVAGGDGTVALAAAALCARGGAPPLGILPVGSGNDFAAELGIPRVPAQAFRVLTEGVPRAVDLIEEGDSARGLAAPARAACVATFGFDALALPIVHGGLPRSKALNVYAAVHGLIRYRPRPLRVTWEGGAFEGPLTFAAVANTRGYGGGFRVAPAARLDDGLLDLCLVPPTGTARLMQLFASVMQGKHGRFPEVVLAQSPWVRIEAADRDEAGELPLSLDGELPARATPIVLRCRPAALTVMCPRPQVDAAAEAPPAPATFVRVTETQPAMEVRRAADA